MSQKRIFHIGIALAGGSTRGAYSAGVMDFLLQALNEWETARLEEENECPAETLLPPWTIRLKTLAGTSAGGITAAITTASICTPFDPLPNNHKLIDDAPKNNKLFEVWVKDITLEKFFSCDDLNTVVGRKGLEPATPVDSMLNSSFMKETAATALSNMSPTRPKPIWAEQLEMFLTTSNLRGVPYYERFRGENQNISDLRMTHHRDWLGFRTYPSKRKDLFFLDLHQRREEGSWDMVRDGAQATASIPLIFPVKSISIPLEMYEKKFESGRPDWPERMSTEYTYGAVDGFVFRNAPLSLVRSSMERGRESTMLSEDAKRVGGAMVLLHPHLENRPFDEEDKTSRGSMVSLLYRLFNSLVDEANFQSEELKDMHRSGADDVSRFVISPMRLGREKGENVLGTDTISGFGGIVDESVRLHDYQLGRQNCQHFLQKVFVIPEEAAVKNPIFGEEALKFGIVGCDGKTRMVPIVPLVGTAREACPLPVWPRFREERRGELKRNIGGTIAKRAKVVVENMAINFGFYSQRFGGWIWNLVVDSLVDIVVRKVMTFVNPLIDDALKQFS